MRKKNSQHEADKIKFSYPLRSKSYILLSRIAVIFVAILIVAVLLRILDSAVWLTNGSAGFYGGIYFLTGMLMSMVFFSWIYSSRQFPIWMSDRYCSCLLDLCDQYSELNDYRLSVVHQGRRFTSAEYVAMTAWLEKKRAAEKLEAERKLAIVKCNQLYKIE